MNQSLFYAQTPNEETQKAHDEGQFYRGMTPQMDQKNVNETQSRLKQTAERVLTKSYSVPQLPKPESHNRNFKMETKKFYGIDTAIKANMDQNALSGGPPLPGVHHPPSMIDSNGGLPTSIKEEYPEAYHEMRKSSNYRSFPAQLPAAKGTLFNPKQQAPTSHVDLEKEGQKYYHDVHVQRANGYAPITEVAKQHYDIEESLRARPSNVIGEGALDLGKTMNDPHAARTARERTFEYNIIANGNALGKRGEL